MAQAVHFVSDACLNAYVLKDFVFSMAAFMCGSMSSATPFQEAPLFVGMTLLYCVELFLHHFKAWQEERDSRVDTKAQPADEESIEHGARNKVAFLVVLAAFILVDLLLCPGDARVIGFVLVALASLEVALLQSQYSGTMQAVVSTCRSVWITMALGLSLQLPQILGIPLAKQLLPRKILLPILAASFIAFGCKVARQIPFLYDDWERGVQTLAVETGAGFASHVATGAMLVAHLSPILFIRSLSHGGLRMVAFIELMLPLLVWMHKSLVVNKQYDYGPTITVANWYAALSLWLITFDVLLSKVRHQPDVWANVIYVLLYIFFAQLQMRVLLLTLPWTKYSEHRVAGPGSPQKVVICGGGIGGIVAAACLQQMGMPYVVIECREANYVDDGADLGLWPSAIATLKLLGVSASFFEEQTHRISRMYIKRIDNGEVLKAIDLDAVVEGTGEGFMLVSRHALMGELRKLVDEKNIMYGCSITAVVSNDTSATVSFRKSTSDESIEAGVLIGADGAYSRCRRFIDREAHIVFKNEVCYRGLVDLSGEPTREKTQAFDNAQLGIMELLLSERIRYSFGYLSKRKDEGYWFVKQRSDKEAKRLSQDELRAHISSWPVALQELYRSTEESRSYVHSIEDISRPLRYWSRGRIVLLGDAAHPVTPNSAQGACMAIDDAVTLTVMLRTHSRRKDSHVRAFYDYQQLRKKVSSSVAEEARMQMKIAHLSDLLGTELRNAILKLAPAKVVQKRLRSIATVSMSDIHGLFQQYTSERLPLVRHTL
eukprot:Plantae.Rhodophyta-Purpureofilum_apyrenoidigerum.ctg7300.p1 GENE.Plantae.Rhodophyta-Purpureofilum_apyrenoidigerum.ctg7300~~Plantae.Rhodophyta-Purpureofilum_apyrenoidigerum.ctg7300.p1  ORF type:complete len:773 (+),score=131.55 Plantae.Rhodophyta-Purpureofilum_apyrenoidigerum.ctg7300:116-2434(+)